MSSKSIMPTMAIGLGEISNGTIINCHSYCRNITGLQKGKCIQYYEEILDVPGIHICPYGFNSFVLKEKEIHEIFTSLRIKDKYDRRKIRYKICKEDKTPEVSDEQLFEMIDLYRYIERLESEHQEANKFVKDVMHEIRNFNSKIITKSELMRIEINKKKPKIKGKLTKETSLTENIFALSSLIEARFLAFDCTINPSSLTFGGKRAIELHKKFYKAQLCCLDEAKNKKINIRLGDCGGIVQLYDSFELVPFLLLDNAIKYSPKEESVEINFEESYNEIKVNIRSIGPYISDDEIKRVYDKGFRANSVININGSGIGLFLVSEICKIHRIDLKIYYNDIKDKYGYFIVQMTINK